MRSLNCFEGGQNNYRSKANPREKYFPAFNHTLHSSEVKFEFPNIVQANKKVKHDSIFAFATPWIGVRQLVGSGQFVTDLHVAGLVRDRDEARPAGIRASGPAFAYLLVLAGKIIWLNLGRCDATAAADGDPARLHDSNSLTPDAVAN